LNGTRPVFLNLTQLKFPPMAISSILHRLSGILLFLFVPLLLYMLSISIASPEGFARLIALQHSFGFQCCLWLGLSAVIYHILAGIRHIIMDFGFAESLKAARVTSMGVIVLGVLGAIIMGVWIW
jgi:succinate dehydrogenase / fumarate reductase, cytochrome b subunit